MSTSEIIPLLGSATTAIRKISIRSSCSPSGAGRYFQPSDFDRGTPYVVLGYVIAQKLFGKAETSIGNTVKLKGGRTAIVIGIIEKQGQSLLGGWDYDNSILLTYSFMKELIRDENAQPKILVQAGEAISTLALKDELKGAMRSIRKLSPTQEDNFALNDIDSLSKFFDPIFRGMNIGGWAIAALSLIVGMFGVANIMFVTVRERTSQIGLKKAIGAKRGVIMMEFLLESAFLCIIGGMIGLAAVFILTLIFSAVLAFKVIVPLDLSCWPWVSACSPAFRQALSPPLLPHAWTLSSPFDHSPSPPSGHSQIFP